MNRTRYPPALAGTGPAGVFPPAHAETATMSKSDKARREDRIGLDKRGIFRLGRLALNFGGRVPLEYRPDHQKSVGPLGFSETGHGLVRCSLE